MKKKISNVINTLMLFIVLFQVVPTNLFASEISSNEFIDNGEKNIINVNESSTDETIVVEDEITSTEEEIKDEITSTKDEIKELEVKVTLPGGGTILSDGTVNLPNGEVVKPEGTILPGGEIITGDYTITVTDGSVVYPNGIVEIPESDIEFNNKVSFSLPAGIKIGYLSKNINSEVYYLPQIFLGDGLEVTTPTGVIVKGSSETEFNTATMIFSGNITHAKEAILPNGIKLVRSEMYNSNINVDYGHQNGNIVLYGGTIILVNGVTIENSRHNYVSVNLRGKISIYSFSNNPDDNTETSITFPSVGTFGLPEHTTINPDGTVSLSFDDYSDGYYQESYLVKLPDGNDIRIPHGSLINLDGSITIPGGNVISIDKTITLANGVRLPRGSFVNPDGSITMPDGAFISKEGIITLSNGEVLPSGSVINENGSFTLPDGTIILSTGVRLPSGSVINPDGLITLPNGNIIDSAGNVISSNSQNTPSLEDTGMLNNILPSILLLVSLIGIAVVLKKYEKKSFNS